MSNFSYEQTRSATIGRSILRNVYIWMTLGLALTGVIAYGVASSPAILSMVFSSSFTFIALIVAQLAIVWFLSARLMKLSTLAATLLFAGYSALNGLTLSVIFLAYTATSISSVFFITAGTFAAMSLWAISTKRDLSHWGSYLFMALIGLIIASLVNFLLRSDFLDYIISFAGVAIFTGLTAYDTQQIKKMSDSYGESVNEEDFIRLSILGALKLYLDFINLFLYLLRILGNRR